jgi:hypothetical protein
MEHQDTPKYSDMLKEMVGKYQELLPEELSLEDIIIIGIDAWNLASRKATENDEGLFQSALSTRVYADVVEKMIIYKLEQFAAYDHVIVDFKIEEDQLMVKSQSQQDHLREMISEIQEESPKNKNKKKWK